MNEILPDEIYSLLMNRYSCRSYQERDIPQDVLEQLLQIAIHSASGGNLQPFSIIVVHDPARRRVLADACGQAFVGQAPVDLVFLLDWHKLSLYTEAADAPFVCSASLDHNLTACEEIACAIARLETAAQFCGLGCCLIGNILGRRAEVADTLALPDQTYPLLLLTLGYPKDAGIIRNKLPYSAMVFEERYDSRSDEELVAGFAQKYQGMNYSLPAQEPQRSQQLNEIRSALLTTYDERRTAAMMEKINATGCLSEIQRRFALHYPAHRSADQSEAMRADLRSAGIFF